MMRKRTTKRCYFMFKITRSYFHIQRVSSFLSWLLIYVFDISFSSNEFFLSSFSTNNENFSHFSFNIKIEWPSNWVEPELGRSTLGLSRVGHRSPVRRVEPGSPVLSERVERVRVFVRRVESNTAFRPTNWIGQAYLFVEHPTRISAHTKISGWAANPRVGPRILFDGLNWTDNSVRRIGLGDQTLSEPEPWASSGALTLGLGFGSCSSGWVGLKKSVRTQPDDHTISRQAYEFDRLIDEHVSCWAIELLCTVVLLPWCCWGS